MITVMIGMALTLTTVLTYIALKLRAIHRHLVTEDRIRDIIAGHPSPETPPPGRRLKLVTKWGGITAGAGWLWQQAREHPREAVAIIGFAAAAGAVLTAALVLPHREPAPRPDAIQPPVTMTRIVTAPITVTAPPAASTATWTAHPVGYALPTVTTTTTPGTNSSATTTIPIPSIPTTVPTVPTGPTTARTRSPCLTLTSPWAHQEICLGGIVSPTQR
ncbi:MAG TPA: hypothetical protein VJL80_11935 [Aeromicrobium sp.]|nr:hypothetical protein [Aeromicrobium sp.]HKY58739.1 hypothetical protein [Aeromicrobium sp.]